MIFVTIGSSSWEFTRLIKEMDRIAGEIDEEVIMQISFTKYETKNAKYFRFKPKTEMMEMYERARVIVSHAGVGTIINALHLGKPLIIVPRRKKFGEAVDDHQVEIAGELEREGRAKAIYDIDKLGAVLMDINAKLYSPKGEGKLVLALSDHLKKIQDDQCFKLLYNVIYKYTYPSYISKILKVLNQCDNLKVLNIGSGRLPINGAINLDRFKLTDVDILADLRYGLPFSDNSFDLVIASSVLEHFTLEEYEFILREMKRVCKQMALIKIQVPYFSSSVAFSTSDHKSFFAINTFWAYREDDPYPYTKKLFKEVKTRLIWNTHRYLRPLNCVISEVVNSSVLIGLIYQNFFCWILPMRAIDVVAIVEKRKRYGEEQSSMNNKKVMNL